MMVKLYWKILEYNTVILEDNAGSSTREEHGLGRQRSWTGHVLEAKQEDCEEWNEK